MVTCAYGTGLDLGEFKGYDIMKPRLRSAVVDARQKSIRVIKARFNGGRSRNHKLRKHLKVESGIYRRGGTGKA